MRQEPEPHADSAFLQRWQAPDFRLSNPLDRVTFPLFSHGYGLRNY